MTNLRTDFVGRINRLPEPRNAADALQPLFESVMNSVHSTQDKYKDQVSKLGKIEINIERKSDSSPIKIIVQDNGVGLNNENYDAFLKTDTMHKYERGGKGVGRLLWLACFDKVKVTSDFEEANLKKRINFDFQLSEQNQIQNEKIENLGQSDNQTGFIVTFEGLRNGRYSEKFPQRPAYLFQHLLSHFLPVLIGNACPELSITYNTESRSFPRDIAEYIKGREKVEIKYKEHNLTLEMLQCDKIVSRNLQGSNFIHFIAHDRTVQSQPIDAKLGFKDFGEDRVFHALVSGIYLNQHVNQERTQFTFDQNIIDEIIIHACMPAIQKFLAEPIGRVKKEQTAALSKIVGYYPSIEFDTVEGLSELVPVGETREDQLFGNLSIHRYRRDNKQREKIEAAIEKLRNENFKFENFDNTLKEASQAIVETERRSLTEYVVRRKVVISFLRELLKSAQKKDGDPDYELESTLHNFICPIRIKSSRVEASSHDLWIIDERLNFSNTFSSDMPFQEILEVSKNGERADLIIFDNAFGLRHSNNDPHVLIVEFKRPGRKSYKDDENPQFQLEKYIRELRSNNTVDIDGRPIRLSDNTRFHCFIVADRLGKINEWTSSWPTTPDGRGRIYVLQGDYKGFIELIEWDQLIDDAEMRSRAFFDSAGINKPENT